jgi:hypothetical protein
MKDRWGNVLYVHKGMFYPRRSWGILKFSLHMWWKWRDGFWSNIRWAISAWWDKEFGEGGG